MTEPLRSPRHLAWVRSLGCCVPGCKRTPIHAHHIRTAATAGTGIKPADRDCANICWYHHAEGHQIGWITWQRRHRIILAAHAARLAQRSRELGILPALAA